jgi:hypothetical protein
VFASAAYALAAIAVVFMKAPPREQLAGDEPGEGRQMQTRVRSGRLA